MAKLIDKIEFKGKGPLFGNEGRKYEMYFRGYKLAIFRIFASRDNSDKLNVYIPNLKMDGVSNYLSLEKNDIYKMIKDHLMGGGLGIKIYKVYKIYHSHYVEIK